jgi:hypothetical protein
MRAQPQPSSARGRSLQARSAVGPLRSMSPIFLAASGSKFCTRDRHCMDTCSSPCMPGTSLDRRTGWHLPPLAARCRQQIVKCGTDTPNCPCAGPSVRPERNLSGSSHTDLSPHRTSAPCGRQSCVIFLLRLSPAAKTSAGLPPHDPLSAVSTGPMGEGAVSPPASTNPSAAPALPPLSAPTLGGVFCRKCR